MNKSSLEERKEKNLGTLTQLNIVIDNQNKKKTQK